MKRTKNLQLMAEAAIYEYILCDCHKTALINKNVDTKGGSTKTTLLPFSNERVSIHKI